eukprot:2445616-Amphidinium_carterae.1
MLPMVAPSSKPFEKTNRNGTTVEYTIPPKLIESLCPTQTCSAHCTRRRGHWQERALDLLRIPGQPIYGKAIS